MKARFKFVVLFFFAVRLAVFAQPIDNLQLFLSLTDSSISSISNTLSREKSYFLKTVNPVEYNILAERSRFAFTNSGIKITDDSSLANVITYSIENARIEYPDIFRDGWFGDYLVERKAEISGAVVTGNGDDESAEEFYIAKTDTIDYDQIKRYELPSLPFTQGKIPAEPFFSSLWEPVIAVGAVVVTVVLLFTTRTK